MKLRGIQILNILNPLVYNSSLFANCLTDLSVSELLTLQHSLQHLPEEEDILENRYTKELQTNDCVETENGKCDKPATLALMAAEER